MKERDDGDELSRLLEEAAACEAAERAEAERWKDAPGASSVARVLAQEWAPTPPRRRWWPRLLLLSCAGVAAALALFFLLGEPDGPKGHGPGPSGDYLNGEEAQILRPRGRLEPWPAAIEWRPAADAREYAVRLLDAESGAELLDLGRTIATLVPFPREDSRAWPQKIEIEVLVLRKDGSRTPLRAVVERAP